MIIYDLGNIADWLSAIGTISAVIVALYLAKRDVKPKLKVISKFSYLVDSINGFSTEPFQLSVEVVNQGLVPVSLTECSISVGKERMMFSNGCQNVNKLLNSGEFYVHNLDYQPIKNYLIERNIKKLKTHVFFKDASGNMYKSKIVFKV
ncbi:hypothetical protein [Clostridium algidicarnis]|uniref:hypothetical protein n=1 Tax=Clostridium algidicarnis TaxID=37659 RepID=UPI003FD6C5FD